MTMKPRVLCLGFFVCSYFKDLKSIKELEEFRMIKKTGLGILRSGLILILSGLAIIFSGIFSLAEAAPQAVLEVNGSQFYAANRNTAYGGASLTDTYAPLPVFFEGWKSSPRAEIVKYEWDFGVGAEEDEGGRYFSGFNAAHVYETPGTYTATLTVTDSAGVTSLVAISITVRSRANQPKYYVDSQLGNDSYDGLVMAEDPSYNSGTGHGPWKTADKAFFGLTNNFYIQRGFGTQILFKRGQVFDVTAGRVEVGNWATAASWLFGAYGTGDKPIIKLTATGGNFNYLIYITGCGVGFATFQDLVFDCSTASGNRANFFYDAGNIDNLLFLRVDIKKTANGITLSGGKTDRIQTGIFIVGCTIYDTTWVSNFATSSHYALLNSNFDLSGNHINYLPYINCGVISGNTFSRPAFGRCALRIDGATPNPTNNIVVTYNNFLGWILFVNLH